MCPCACSPEGLTVSIRRPGREGVNATGRGVLSMSGLSHGVVRVDQENSLTSLTLQDCGQVLPGSTLVVVKIEGSPQVCKTDEVTIFFRKITTLYHGWVIFSLLLIRGHP